MRKEGWAFVATVTLVEFTDDIDGKPLDINDLNVVSWSWLGVEYEFETSTANLDRVENGRLPLATLLAKSRRVGGRKRTPARTHRPPTPTVSASSDTKSIRQWAQQNGYTISDRGRLPADIVEAYNQS